MDENERIAKLIEAAEALDWRATPGSDKYPCGNTQDLHESIRKILDLPERTTLYSGHSEPTAVKDERRNYHI
ncbi:MAG: hypothetical protein II877_06920 [Synergistaceae bacterium]|nr:hypothetical protein [Synergistaceae bacterium]